MPNKKPSTRSLSELREELAITEAAAQQAEGEATRAERAAASARKAAAGLPQTIQRAHARGTALSKSALEKAQHRIALARRQAKALERERRKLAELEAHRDEASRSAEWHRRAHECAEKARLVAERGLVVKRGEAAETFAQDVGRIHREYLTRLKASEPALKKQASEADRVAKAARTRANDLHVRAEELRRQAGETEASLIAAAGGGA